MLIEKIENQIFRKAAPLAIRYLAKPDLDTKDLLSRKVLDQSAKEFQVAPPITIHMSNPVLMAGVWSATREAYVVNHKGRSLREAVAAAVSTLNECPYCVTIHSSLFASTGGMAEHLDEPEKLSPDIGSAYAWAKATLTPDANVIKNPPFSVSEIPQIYGTAVIYHYINRVVSVFLGETPVALPGMNSSLGKKMMQASFAFFGNRFANLDPEPGQFIIDDAAELPEAFSWASANPDVAKGLAQFAQSAEKAGVDAVPEEVRVLVLDHLSTWNGETAPLSRAWIEELVVGLGDQQKPVARLALLSARAAWQVDESLINEFRKINPSDRALLQTVAWASYAASRRIASWFKTS